MCHLLSEDGECKETGLDCDFPNPDDMEEYMNYCESYNEYMGR